MAGTKGCMLEFNADTKLTSEEFVKVFKEFDKDGKNMNIVNTIFYRHCGSLNRVLISSRLKNTRQPFLTSSSCFRQWLHRGGRTRPISTNAPAGNRQRGKIRYK